MRRPVVAMLGLMAFSAGCDDSGLAEAALAVWIQSPLANAHVGRQVSVLGRAAGGDEVSRVEVSVDDGPFVLADGTSRWTYVLDSTLLSDGPHVLAARGTDAAGATALDEVQVMVVNGADSMAGPEVRTSSFGAADDSAALELVKPTATSAGELLVAFVAHDSGTQHTVPAPTGWTYVSTVTADAPNGARTYVFWKLAEAAEPDSYTFTPTPAYAHDMVGGIWAVTGADPVSPIDATGVQVMLGSTTCTAPSVTTTVDDTLLLYACARNNTVTSFTPPPGMTEDWDLVSSGSARMSNEGAHQAVPVAGPVGERTATSAAGDGVALSLAIRPR